MKAGGRHVSPAWIIRMDRARVNPHAAPQCAPGACVGAVELRDCAHPVVWAPNGRDLSGLADRAKGGHGRAAALRMVLRYLSHSGPQTADPGRHHVFCPLAALDCDLVDGDTPGLGPRRHDLGGAVCGAAPECRLSRMRHPRSLDRLARQPAWRLATGMVALVAGRASCHPTGLDGAGAGGPRFVGVLALWAHGASGLASAAADQQRGQVPSCWPDTVVLAPRVGPRREPVLVWPGDRLCLASAAGRLYAGGVVG